MRIYYLASLALFALGLMSKPMLVTLPFVMLLLDYWPLRRIPTDPNRGAWLGLSKASFPNLGRLLVEKLPFFALAIGISVVTFVAQKHQGAMQEDIAAAHRFENAAISYCRYLGKLLYPADLSIVYPYVDQWPMWAVLFAVLLLVGISGTVVVFGRENPYLPVGWFWFLGTLVPVIGLVQVGRQSMADRYTYIPFMGLLLLMVWGGQAMIAGKRAARAVGALGVCAILVLVGLTYRQSGYWRNSEVLFDHAIAVTKGNYIAHYCLGFALDKQGRFDEAIGQYAKAIELYPNYTDAHNNLGVTLRKKGQPDQAIQQFQEALRLDSANPTAHFNLGFTLVGLGHVDEAIDQYQQALQLKPDYPDALNNLGIALGRKGRADDAILSLQRAATVQPGSAEIHYNLANALFRRGRVDEAILHFAAALELQPDHAEAHNNLGVALSRQRRWPEAAAQFQEAVRLKPDYLEAQKNFEAARRVLEKQTAPLKDK